MAEDIDHFVTDHDELLEYDFETFVGGHLGRAGTRENVEVAREYVLDLVREAGEARGAVDFASMAGRVGYENKWLLTRTWMDEVAGTCAEAMIGKWGKVLGGRDVSTPGRCRVMQEFIGIDGEPSRQGS